jgi:hypothetical protein
MYRAVDDYRRETWLTRVAVVGQRVDEQRVVLVGDVGRLQGQDAREAKVECLNDPDQCVQSIRWFGAAHSGRIDNDY